MKSKETIFVAAIAVAIIFTIVFVIIYIGRVRHPVVFEREEAYILFNGKDQVITGVYHFRNTLPMNAALPLTYSFQSGNGLGNPVDWTISLRHSSGESALNYVFSSEASIDFELALPPFSSGELVVNFRQPVMGNHLGYKVQSGNAWGVARKGVTAFLNLPEGYKLVGTSTGEWEAASNTDWDWKYEIARDAPSDISVEFTLGAD